MFGYYNPYYMYGMDPKLMILFFAVFAFVMYAQMKVQSNYNKYSKVKSTSGLTGYQVARMILDKNDLHDIEILQASGRLSDHYNPQKRTINLSSGVYDSDSVAAIAIAAHECGHAIQHKIGYRSLVLRNSLLPLFNVSQWAGLILIFVGLLMSSFNLAIIGLIAYSAILVFQLLTLPIEFNASSRALSILENGMISSGEVSGASRVLSAAALTYVAALASTLVSILRFLVIILGSSRRD